MTSGSARDKSAADADKNKDDKSKDDKIERDTPVTVKVDADGIGQRILALPVPARNYVSMLPGKTGVLFLAEAPLVVRESDFENLKITVQRFDLSKRKVEKFLDDVNDFAVSFDGEKILYRKTDQWTIAGTAEPPAADAKPKPGEGPLKLEGMQLRIEPMPLWRQMFHEAWRIQRDFFYDPRHHGLDLPKIEKKYEPYLAGLASREDLNYLLEESLGEMTVGHMFIGGGERPQPKKFKGGLLGADYATRERPLSGHARLQRRELESGSAGAADAAGRQRHGGRVHPRRCRTRIDRVGRHLCVLRGDRGAASAREGRSER